MRLRNRFNRIQTIITRAIKQFDRQRGFEAAASLAFYSVVSLFPMLLLTIAGASLWFEGQEAKQRVLQILFEFTPTLSQELIRRNIEKVLEQRQGSSVVALLVLLWSASSVFNVLTQNINRAWAGTHERTIISSRLLSMASGFGLFLLLMMLFMVQHAANALEDTQWARNPLVAILIPSSKFLTLLFGLASLTALYKLVPTRKVKWCDAAVGAIGSVIGAEMVTAVYGYYLSARFEQYNLIYGSLATIMGFMFWTFAIHGIVLFGAHLSAQTAARLR